jgi:hypothetical protein
MTTHDDLRLYGEDGDEELFTTIDDYLDAQEWRYIDRHADGETGPWPLQEWTVTTPRAHLPQPDWITEQILELHLCDAEIDERAFEWWQNAAIHPDVQAAFENALSVWASKVGYWMADKQVATHQIGFDGTTFTIDGTPR